MSKYLLNFILLFTNVQELKQGICSAAGTSSGLEPQKYHRLTKSENRKSHHRRYRKGVDTPGHLKYSVRRGEVVAGLPVIVRVLVTEPFITEPEGLGGLSWESKIRGKPKAIKESQKY